MPTHRHSRAGRSRSRAQTVVALIVALPLVAIPASAQQLGWSGSVDASANILFGNTRDRLLAGRVQAGRADSTLEIRTDARFSYAESTNDDGDRVVRGRTTFLSLGTDYLPFARYSPFWFGSVESSFQQRIERRYSTGAGAKLTFYRRKDSEASISAAVLAERTQPRDDDPAATDTSRAHWLSRWSVRGRIRRQLSKTTRFSHTTFYQPALEQIDRYTINSTTTFGIDLTQKLALTFTFHDTYDSESRDRGARSNNDGQLLFGVNARF